MDNFRYKNKEIEFWKITGNVIDHNKYSETHVFSSGGGGYVGPSGGHVSTPQINSTVVTNQELWINTDDGREVNVQFSDRDIPLREGQRVTLIGAKLKGKDTGYYSVLINHNANQHWFINDAGGLNKQLKIYQISGRSLLVAIAIWILVSFVAPTEFGLFFAIVFLAVWWTIKVIRAVLMCKALNRHLVSLAQTMY